MLFGEMTLWYSNDCFALTIKRALRRLMCLLYKMACNALARALVAAMGLVSSATMIGKDCCLQ